MHNIKLVVLDVDGTLTDGKIYIDNNGVETKAFHVKDGLAIVQAMKHDLEIVIITGRSSHIVDIRARELSIEEVHQGVKNKNKKLREILERKNLQLDQVAYIGDDINDLHIMKLVAFAACPKDAVKEVKEIVHFTSKYNGGEGAVREVLEYILEQRNLWNQIVEQYEGCGQ